MASDSLADAHEIEPRWGIGDAVLGFLVAIVAAGFVQVIALSATGEDPADWDPALSTVALLQLPLWAGLIGVPWWVTRTKGNGLVRDLGFRFERSDVGRGLLLGIVTQLVLVPLLYLPVQLFSDDVDIDDLSEPARELTDRAADAFDVVALVVIVGVGAPIAEEIFYRGLLQRALARRFRPSIAIGVSALVFAGSHFQGLQFPALFMFGVVAGVVAHRTGRLGPSIVMHLVFNLTAVTSLLAQS